MYVKALTLAKHNAHEVGITHYKSELISKMDYGNIGQSLAEGACVGGP